MRFWIDRLALIVVVSGWQVTVSIAEEMNMNEAFVLPYADIVIIGEIHDNPDHHLAQAKIIAAIEPASVVFEMLDPQQARLADAADVRSEKLAAELGWADSGWPAWSLYAPVFEAIGSARIYGAALPREAVRAAVKDGAASQFGEDAGRYGLDDQLDPSEQTIRKEEQLQAHCGAIPHSMLSGMVEAQRLRDAAFARTALEAYEHTGGPVVVIAGTGHARKDRGIAAAISLAAPEVTILSIGQLEEPPADPSMFDFWLIAPAPERADPCDGFETSLPRDG